MLSTRSPHARCSCYGAPLPPQGWLSSSVELMLHGCEGLAAAVCCLHKHAQPIYMQPLGHAKLDAARCARLQ